MEKRAGQMSRPVVVCFTPHLAREARATAAPASEPLTFQWYVGLTGNTETPLEAHNIHRISDDHDELLGPRNHPLRPCRQRNRVPSGGRVAARGTRLLQLYFWYYFVIPKV